MQADPSMHLHPKRIQTESWAAWQGKDIALTAGSGARAWLLRELAFPLLVLVPDQRQQRELQSDLKSLSVKGISISTLSEIPLTLEGMTQKAIRVRRGEELAAWKRNGGFLLSTPGALLGPYALADGSFHLQVGNQRGRSNLIAWLSGSGYERSETVWSPGQFVIRGSIVDLFDPTHRNPLRVEFLDERIESLRFFRPETQRSTGALEEISLAAVKEGKIPGLREFFPQAGRVLLFEPAEIASQADHYRWVWEGLREEAGVDKLQEWDQLYVLLSNLPLLRIKASIERVAGRIDMGPIPSFKGRRQALGAAVDRWKGEGLTLQVHTASETLSTWFKDREIPVAETPLSCGFISQAERTVFLSDSDISGIVSLPQGEGNGVTPLEWNDRLAMGEWVVHEDYGIGRFVGLESISTPQSFSQEYLVIEYAGGQRLLVPPFLLWKVTTYIAPRGSEPTPDSLKSGVWKKSISRVRKSVHEAAQELLDTYARREISPGFSYPPDADLSRDVERSFPYSETADQLRSIAEIKNDMQSDHPMDRLLVGDVGFGKTEVALRVAVKAAEAGKQVAFLVPTTLLAQQHYDTFISRTADLPIRVEVLCRFVPKKRQAEIVKRVADGRVDILIGTHRLVQKDVRFKDLGLVIVDEEHRFGVLHKEHSKGLKPEVDVLMMSATPIPRTLFLSLGGLRDISVISTPPHRRYPVVTVVSPWREDLVLRGVLREKARGGQTFFVHNRVADIEATAASLRLLFPQLAIDVAHGQMPESTLEKAMLRFNAGETDILVCTTIIESGLDIPRANTLIVDDAHELGLAQLYQLRGRVGRREEQAFAYFLYPREKNLTPESRERLEAVGELSEPGSGYDLAHRDLEIRGGGQVVGTAQHGHVDRVGYHLYCRMLEEQVSALKGQSRTPTRIEIKASLQIPETYIPQPAVRVALYRKLLRAQDRNDLETTRSEVLDRFGPIPAAVGFLFDVALLRLYGERLGIDSVQVAQTETTLRGLLTAFPPGERPGGWRWGKNWAIGPGGAKGIAFIAGFIREYFEVRAGLEV